MSLDVWLTLPGVEVAIEAQRIFIRENGRNVEISREEWDRRYPGREPFTVVSPEIETVYDGNITHNLNSMAEAAGIYGVLWRPDKNGITHALQLIDPLRTGLAALKNNPDVYKTFNPENGWGTYEGLVSFVEEYLAACEQYPSAEVSVWR